MGRVLTANRTVSSTVYNMSYVYDYMGNVTRINYPSSSGTRRLVEYTYKTGTGELDKARDITGTAFDYVQAATYSPLGTLQQMDMTNNVTNPTRTTLGWNKRFQLTSILTQKVGGSTHLNLGYTYFLNGQIQQINYNNDPNNLQTWKYTYDELLRLATAQRGPDANIQTKYSYDDDRYGNRWLQDLVAGTGYETSHSFNSANNRVTTARFTGVHPESRNFGVEGTIPATCLRQAGLSGEVFPSLPLNSHISDPSGLCVLCASAVDFSCASAGDIPRLPTLTRGTMFPTLPYNLENFMTAAGSSTYVGVYPERSRRDAQGRRACPACPEHCRGERSRRMKKTVSGVTTDYFYLGGVVVSEKQGTNWTDYVFFGGQRIAKQTGSTASTATYWHTDHLGSTRVCTDSSGNSTGSCTYEPFGELQAGTTCPATVTYRYAGMEYDSETGFYHTWFRQYDTAQGRWLSVDPLAGSSDAPQSLNRYAYVLNDPTNLIDPLGLQDDRGDPPPDCWFNPKCLCEVYGICLETEEVSVDNRTAMEHICRANPGSLLCWLNFRPRGYLGNEGLSFKELLLELRKQARKLWSKLAADPPVPCGVGLIFYGGFATPEDMLKKGELVGILAIDQFEGLHGGGLAEAGYGALGGGVIQWRDGSRTYLGYAGKGAGVFATTDRVVGVYLDLQPPAFIRRKLPGFLRKFLGFGIGGYGAIRKSSECAQLATKTP